MRLSRDETDDEFDDGGTPMWRQMQADLVAEMPQLRARQRRTASARKPTGQVRHVVTTAPKQASLGRRMAPHEVSSAAVMLIVLGPVAVYFVIVLAVIAYCLLYDAITAWSGF